MDFLSIPMISIVLLSIALFSTSLLYLRKNREAESNNKLYVESQRQLKLIRSSLNRHKQIDIKAEDDFARVINQFKDDDWLIYRNVTWQWRGDGSVTNYMKEGEVDFLLVHKNLGIVMIEVKGGRGWSYDATKHVWTLKTRDGTSIKKGPYEQLRRNRKGLSNKIQYESRKLGLKNFRPKIETFVVWPNVSSNESKFGFIGFEENTIYLDELDSPDLVEAKLKRQFIKSDYSNDDLIILFNRILNNNIKGFSLLSYSGKISEKVERISEDVFKSYYEITNPDYKKIKIQGIPGSGKTFLASKIADFESNNDRKVLFICYNILLGEKLKAEFENDESVKVIIFEELLDTLGLTYDAIIEEPDKTLKDLSKEEEVEFIRNFLEDSIGEADDMFEFDTLIIDEAQDFSEKYWEFFVTLVESKFAKWILCYDNNQNISHKEWNTPEYLDTPPFVLNTVIRSTKEIADKYTKLFDDSIEHFGEQGVEPSLILLEKNSWKSVEIEVVKILESLNEESPDLLKKVTLLLPHSKDIQNLKLDDFKEINISSVSKFKGLEADIVILVFPSLESVERSYIQSTQAMLYIGLSRAKTNLYFICNKEVKDLAKWKVM